MVAPVWAKEQPAEAWAMAPMVTPAAVHCAAVVGLVILRTLRAAFVATLWSTDPTRMVPAAVRKPAGRSSVSAASPVSAKVEKMVRVSWRRTEREGWAPGAARAEVMAGGMVLMSDDSRSQFLLKA